MSRALEKFHGKKNKHVDYFRLHFTPYVLATFFTPAGVIPKELGKLKMLLKIDVSNNQLTGERKNKVMGT